MGQAGRFRTSSRDSQLVGLYKAQGPEQSSKQAICILHERCLGWRWETRGISVSKESGADTHSIFVGALTHSEIFSQSESRRTKSNVNSPATSYGLNIESTRISLPNSGASSSTISSSSVTPSEAFLPAGGEAERELEEFVPLGPSDGFKNTIGGGETEERETSMSLSELVLCGPTERLVDARPLPL
jgi:hypothetical protein